MIIMGRPKIAAEICRLPHLTGKKYHPIKRQITGLVMSKLQEPVKWHKRLGLMPSHRFVCIFYFCLVIL